MLDIIAAIYVTLAYATQTMLLAGFSQVRMGTRLAICAASAIWLSIVVAVYALGGLSPGALGPIPVNLAPFGLALAILFGGWVLVPQVRVALLSVPLPALVAVHAGRIGGLFFLILYYDGRLSAPFAPFAGAGDMITGAIALVLVAALALGFKVGKLWVGAWNAFGALDLLIAVTLGVLSAPGTPFRIFTEGPGTVVMATLPWIFVPAILVPFDLLVHFVIWAKLKSAPRWIGAAAMAG